MACIAIFLFACKKTDSNIGTFTAPEKTIQQGMGRSWITLNAIGAPFQLAISISDAALNSMPEHGDESEVMLSLPAAAKHATPFDHIAIGWNPHGHDPSGVYDKPHFDFHFYMVCETEVSASTDTVKLDLNPPAAYLPHNYVPGTIVAKMGKHFIDVISPELNGQPFTETFIYGSCDGKVTFYEPMLTLAFLKSTNHFERKIPQPEKYLKSGYYPTKFSIVKHDGITDIILEGFEKRQGS